MMSGVLVGNLGDRGSKRSLSLVKARGLNYLLPTPKSLIDNGFALIKRTIPLRPNTLQGREQIFLNIEKIEDVFH